MCLFDVAVVDSSAKVLLSLPLPPSILRWSHSLAPLLGPDPPQEVELYFGDWQSPAQPIRTSRGSRYMGREIERDTIEVQITVTSN